jgi:anti-sigma regulatory factor (Ser/Thr protein kinase)
MSTTAKDLTSLLTISLLSAPFSAFAARYQVRVALQRHDLYDYVSDAATVTSELVTNAITHTNTEKIGFELSLQQDPEAIRITVTDSSPKPPERLDPADIVEYGRGLNIVDTLSASWGWTPQGTGKAVYAILVREA